MSDPTEPGSGESGETNPEEQAGAASAAAPDIEAMMRKMLMEQLKDEPTLARRFIMPPKEKQGVVHQADPGDLPPGFVLPADYKIPKGRQVVFLTFKGSITQRPDKGDRRAIVWALSDMDERLCHERCMGDGTRLPSEQAKGMIRLIDGHRISWAGLLDEPGNVEQFWEDIGPQYRHTMRILFQKLHYFRAEEQNDFFENCVQVRTVV